MRCFLSFVNQLMFKMFNGNRLSESNIQLSGPISCFLSAWSSSHFLVVSGHRATRLLLADMQEPLQLAQWTVVPEHLSPSCLLVRSLSASASYPLLTYPHSHVAYTASSFDQIVLYVAEFILSEQFMETQQIHIWTFFIFCELSKVCGTHFVEHG